MKVVDKFDFPVTTGASIYDWDAILKAKVPHDQLGKPGPAVVLEEGKDFEKKEDARPFLSMIRNSAAKRHLVAKCVLVEKEGKPKLVYVQVADMTDAEIAEIDSKLETQKEAGKAKRLAKKAAAVATPTPAPVVPAA